MVESTNVEMGNLFKVEMWRRGERNESAKKNPGRGMPRAIKRQGISR